MGKQKTMSSQINNLFPTKIQGFDSLAKLALDMN